MDADMNAHSVTVTFDDAQADVAGFVKALNDAGYTVGDPVRK